MKILIAFSGLLECNSFGVGTSIKGYKKGLNDNGVESVIYDKSFWTPQDEQRLRKISRLLSHFFRLTGLSSLEANIFAERWIHSRKLIDYVGGDKTFTHIWFQDPVIAFFYLIQIKMFFFAKNKYRIIVSQHNAGSSANALIMEGYSVPRKIYSSWCRIERWVIRKSLLTISPSVYARNAICRDLGLLACPENFKVIKNGRPEINKTQKNIAREMLGLSATTFYILVVGRVSEIKNTSKIIEAAKRISKKNLPLKFIFLGASRHEVQLNGFNADDINIITCEYQATDLFYSSADIYISASLEESYGHASIEAIGYGLPSLIGAGGGAVDVCKYACEFISPDPDSITVSILRLYYNNERRLELQQATANIFSTIPNWTEVAYMLCKEIGNN